MWTNKRELALFGKRLGNRVEQIELFAEYTECANMKNGYLVSVTLGVGLFI